MNIFSDLNISHFACFLLGNIFIFFIIDLINIIYPNTLFYKDKKNISIINLKK